MKTTKLIYLLAIALAVTLAATGCKHGTTTVTPLPKGWTPTPVAPGPGPTMPYTPEAGPGTRIETAEGWRVEDYDPDRAALAAYTIHFAYDSAVVRNSEKANLQSVAQALNADMNAKLLVEGNCDERGTEEYNRSLGERRALAAREALAKLGVDPMRVRTISYGKDKPLDPGHDDAAWKQNRRDDFVLLHPKTGGAAPAPGSMGGS